MQSQICASTCSAFCGHSLAGSAEVSACCRRLRTGLLPRLASPRRDNVAVRTLGPLPPSTCRRGPSEWGWAPPTRHTHGCDAHSRRTLPCCSLKQSQRAATCRVSRGDWRVLRLAHAPLVKRALLAARAAEGDPRRRVLSRVFREYRYGQLAHHLQAWPLCQRPAASGGRMPTRVSPNSPLCVAPSPPTAPRRRARGKRSSTTAAKELQGRVAACRGARTAPRTPVRQPATAIGACTSHGSSTWSYARSCRAAMALHGDAKSAQGSMYVNRCISGAPSPATVRTLPRIAPRKGVAG